MTSLPSRLQGVGPTLRSLARQDRQPDRLILSLPRRSAREGKEYVVPPEIDAFLAKNPWAEVHTVEEDFGPGTKLLGSLGWLKAHPDQWREGDVLMILDDDHDYMPFALAELLREQLSRGPGSVCSFFAYFFRGIMVPQGADIIAFQLSETLIQGILDFHRTLVLGNQACFLVDDLWIGMYAKVAGKAVVSLRELVVRRGLQTIYARTENAKVVALESLGGEDRRDRVTLRAFDGLLTRLVAGGAEALQQWGGRDAESRIKQLETEVKMAERQISEISRWLEQMRSRDPDDEANPGVQKAAEQLAKLKHLYQMQVAPPAAKK